MSELAHSLMMAPPEKSLTLPLSRSISERDVCPSSLDRLPPSTCRSSQPQRGSDTRHDVRLFHSPLRDKRTRVTPVLPRTEQNFSVCAAQELKRRASSDTPIMFCSKKHAATRLSNSFITSHVTHSALSLFSSPFLRLFFFFFSGNAW